MKDSKHSRKYISPKDREIELIEYDRPVLLYDGQARKEGWGPIRIVGEV